MGRRRITQGSNSRLFYPLHCRQILYPLSNEGSAFHVKEITSAKARKQSVYGVFKKIHINSGRREVAGSKKELLKLGRSPMISMVCLAELDASDQTLASPCPQGAID